MIICYFFLIIKLHHRKSFHAIIKKNHTMKPKLTTQIKEVDLYS